MRTAQPVLIVNSVKDAIDWYQKVLGFQTVYENARDGDADSPSYAVLLNGNAGLHLARAADMDNPAGHGACNFVTKEFAQALQAAKDANARFYVELGTVPTGQRTFGIKDPDGNLISLVEAS